MSSQDRAWNSNTAVDIYQALRNATQNPDTAVAELGKILDPNYAGVGNNISRVITAEYDFAVSGGAVSEIDLGVEIPVGTIIRSTTVEVIDSVTGVAMAEAGIVAKIGASGANVDLVAGAVIATSLPDGISTGVQVETAATMVKAVVSGNIFLDIDVAALTAGRFRVYLETLPGQV